MGPNAAIAVAIKISGGTRRRDERLLHAWGGFLSWVAEKSDKRLIGFLEASIRDVAEDCDTRNVAYIEGWYVEPDFRKTGVGGLLASHAAQWARAKGCKEMGSDCELDNEISLKAHLGLGFEETSRLIHFRKRL